MNCPVCGKEMEKGKVVTSNSCGVYFLPPDGDADAFILTAKYITKQGGVVLDGPYNTNFPNDSEFSAAICRDCRNIVKGYELADSTYQPPVTHNYADVAEIDEELPL